MCHGLGGAIFILKNYSVILHAILYKIDLKHLILLVFMKTNKRLEKLKTQNYQLIDDRTGMRTQISSFTVLSVRHTSLFFMFSVVLDITFFPQLGALI